MISKRIFNLLLSILIVSSLNGQSKKLINLPDFSGYQTLKCDFHMHTVFSDGTVWPTVRIEEAASEGLDAIAITDHIEYLPHSKDIDADHNRSYEIAKPLADEMDILLIRGTEITRSMPPGHLNALFITNANLIDRQDIDVAIKEARDQGALLLWNHPGWKQQQPDTTLWWEKHTELYENDMLHGIEVFNGEFCKEALHWAVEKKLTMFGNSDVHGPIHIEEGHRPMTLVFAKSRTEGGIKEALFNQRTAVYFDNTVIGKAEHLEPFFFASLEIGKIQNQSSDETAKVVRILNKSDIDYELELMQPVAGFDVPEKVTLKARHETALKLTSNTQNSGKLKNLEVYYQIRNLLTNVDESLIVTISFESE